MPPVHQGMVYLAQPDCYCRCFPSALAFSPSFFEHLGNISRLRIHFKFKSKSNFSLCKLRFSAPPSPLCSFTSLSIHFLLRAFFNTNPRKIPPTTACRYNSLDQRSPVDSSLTIFLDYVCSPPPSRYHIFRATLIFPGFP
jgi:hypothetical protein